MKFKDQKLENMFLENLWYDEFKMFGKVYAISCLILGLAFLSFFIYYRITGPQNPHFVKVLLMELYR
jgi:hypothetical protein